MSACGSCTACCTLMKVDMQPPKPARERCPLLCSKGGCSVYDRRPEPCRVFSCLWLGAREIAKVDLGAAMRPDRTGVVMEANSVGTIIAHCQYRDSWRREPMRSFLLDQATRTVVMLNRPGEDAVLLTAAGVIEELLFVGLDATTNERLYARVSELEAISDE